jgi:hypothetical protein
LSKLFDMVHFGQFDYDEIDRQIRLRHDRTARLIEGLKSES